MSVSPIRSRKTARKAKGLLSSLLCLGFPRDTPLGREGGKELFLIIPP